MLQNELIVIKPSVLESEEKHINSLIVNPDSDDTALKQELRIAAGHCQLLAEKLCRNELVMTREGGMLTAPEPFTSPEGECCRQQKLKNTAIVAENIKIRQVLKDVTEVNKRWQKYNAQQQDYIQRLHTTIETLQPGVEHPTVETSHIPFRQEEDENKISTAEASRTILFLKRSYENAQKECSRLEELVEELRTELSSKDKELQTAKKTAEKGCEVELSRAQEAVEIMSIQAKMYKEDWEVERTENERIRGKLVKAETNVRDLTNKCDSLTSHLQRIQAATLDFGDDSNCKVGTSELCEEDVDRNCRQNQVQTLGIHEDDLLFALHHSSFKESTKDIEDCSRKYSWEEEEEAVNEMSLGDPMNTRCKQYQMTTNVLASRLQPRVISRGSSRRSWDNFSKKDIVCGEVELDFARTQSLPIDITSSDLQRFDSTKKLTVFEVVKKRANRSEAGETHQGQYLRNQELVLSEQCEDLQNKDQTNSKCVVNLK